MQNKNYIFELVDYFGLEKLYHVNRKKKMQNPILS